MWKSLWKTFGEVGKGWEFAGRLGMWETLWESEGVKKILGKVD